MEWKPIERGEVTIVDSPAGSPYITAETTVTGSPDAEWRTIFNDPAEAPPSVLGRRPQIVGDKIIIEVAKADELQYSVQYVDRAIAWANQKQQAQRSAAHDAEIAKARDIAKGL
jgi:hypothetical protein